MGRGSSRGLRGRDGGAEVEVGGSRARGEVGRTHRPRHDARAQQVHEEQRELEAGDAARLVGEGTGNVSTRSPAAALLLATGGLLSSAAGHAWPAVICCGPRVANWELSRPRVAYSDR